jgi:hypothetical protein
MHKPDKASMGITVARLLEDGGPPTKVDYYEDVYSFNGLHENPVIRVQTTLANQIDSCQVNLCDKVCITFSMALPGLVGLVLRGWRNHTPTNLASVHRSSDAAGAAVSSNLLQSSQLDLLLNMSCCGYRGRWLWAQS